jgi:hypothetical protein
MASASEIVKDSVIEFRHIDHLFAQYARLCALCAIANAAFASNAGCGIRAEGRPKSTRENPSRTAILQDRRQLLSTRRCHKLAPSVRP